jgi:ssDNA-binding Zn-finger/Zn-ribbon topoisomerase 1
MALRALPDPDDRIPAADIQGVVCPVCNGRMELVYDRHHQKVVVCVDCQSGLTVPEAAWEIARIKREARRTRQT